ncbi:MAG: hypothetical protein ACFFDK_15440 [Promethearchaeota archaeon]
MSKKYEHRIEVLEEHKSKKEKGHHANRRHKKNNQSLKNKKKAQKEFIKKMRKTNQIW